MHVERFYCNRNAKWLDNVNIKFKQADNQISRRTIEIHENKTAGFTYLIDLSFLVKLVKLLLIYHNKVNVNYKDKKILISINSVKKESEYNKKYDAFELIYRCTRALAHNSMGFKYEFDDMINLIKFFEFDKVFLLSLDEMRALRILVNDFFTDNPEDKNIQQYHFTELFGLYVKRKGKMNTLSTLGINLNKYDKNLIFICREAVESFVSSHNQFDSLYTISNPLNKDISVNILEYIVLLHEFGHLIFSYNESSKSAKIIENQANYFASAYTRGMLDLLIKELSSFQPYKYRSHILYTDIYNGIDNKNIGFINVLYEGNDF